MFELYTSVQSFHIINVKNPILHPIIIFKVNYLDKPVCILYFVLLTYDC